jgi:hypothetical protein
MHTLSSADSDISTTSQPGASLHSSTTQHTFDRQKPRDASPLSDSLVGMLAAVALDVRIAAAVLNLDLYHQSSW